MLSRLSDPPEDVSGYDHYLQGNLAHSNNQIDQINLAQCTLIDNTFDESFDGTVSDQSFISLDENQLIATRKVDGSLPDITFLKPTPESGLEGIGYFASEQDTTQTLGLYHGDIVNGYVIDGDSDKPGRDNDLQAGYPGFNTPVSGIGIYNEALEFNGNAIAYGNNVISANT